MIDSILQGVPFVGTWLVYNLWGGRFPGPGFIPRLSVLEAVTHLLGELDGVDPARLTDPRGYNIRWLELLNELKPRLDQFQTVL